MTKVLKLSELSNTFSFTEYDYLKNQELAFCNTELGKIKELFPLSELANQYYSINNCCVKLGRKELFTPTAKLALMILKMRYNLSDRSLIEQLNSNSHFQIFCGIFISPLSPLVDYKIVSRIRVELSKRINLIDFQQLLFESVDWIYKEIKSLSKLLQCPIARTKYLSVMMPISHMPKHVRKHIRKDVKYLAVYFIY